MLQGNLHMVCMHNVVCSLLHVKLSLFDKCWKSAVTFQYIQCSVVAKELNISEWHFLRLKEAGTCVDAHGQKTFSSSISAHGDLFLLAIQQCHSCIAFWFLKLRVGARVHNNRKGLLVAPQKKSYFSSINALQSCYYHVIHFPTPEKGICTSMFSPLALT